MNEAGFSTQWMYVEKYAIDYPVNSTSGTLSTSMYQIWLRLEGTNLLEAPLCHSTQILKQLQTSFPFLLLTMNVTQMVKVNGGATSAVNGGATSVGAHDMVDVELTLLTSDTKASPEGVYSFFNDPVTSSVWLGGLKKFIDNVALGSELQKSSLMNMSLYKGITDSTLVSSFTYIDSAVQTLLPAVSSQGSDPNLPLILGVTSAVVLVFAIALIAGGIKWGRWRTPGRRVRKSGFGIPNAAMLPWTAFQELSAVDIQILKRPDGSDWLLGSGTYGQVYRGRLKGEIDVAVKLLQPHLAEGVRGYLEHEVKILRMAAYSSYVVRVLGACIQGSSSAKGPMIIMEYMQAGDLSAVIAADSEGKYSWYREGHKVALDIARGLAFLHSIKIVHRDLKASNILLTALGMAKIGDCGLAKVMEESAVSASGAPAGTFAFAAPEILMGQRYSEKADCYSFGVLLWQIVSRQKPRRGQIGDLSIPEDCPQEVDDLITSCMDPDPNIRPSGSEIVRQLARQLDKLASDSSEGTSETKS